MITNDQLMHITGAEVRDRDGEKIGKVEQVYADDVTGTADWVTVATGFFGTNVSFVPLGQATWDGEALHVPYEKSQIKDAPSIDPDASLSTDEEQALYRHYGLDASSSQTADAGVGTAGVTGTEGYDTSGPTTDDAMTRSEEHLAVGTREEEVGRVRLRKYVVTEQQTVSVPVSHEEVRIEREPITDANRDAALGGPEISEEEHEVVLHREVPVVSTETEAVERVRIGTETVAETEEVTGEVRKEQIEVEDDTTRR